MVAKGSGKTCCCNGCEEPPQPNTANITAIERSSWQTNCCACLPKMACLTVLTNDLLHSDRLTYSLYCPTTAYGLNEPVYMPITSSGKFLVNGVAFDVAVHFEVADGVCQMCLTSTALGITKSTYGACITIDDAARTSPNFFCSRLSKTDAIETYGTDRNLGQGPTSDGIGTRWTIGAYTFVLSRADHIAITPRPNCLDSYGNQVIDTNSIKDKCCNCSCIARCACLTKRSITGTTSESACLVGTDWTFPSGAVVSITSTAYDRTCYLGLSPDETGGSATLPVALGGVETKCPRPIARWGTTLPAAGAIPSHVVYYEFQASGCDGGCNVDVSGCCANERTSFPRILHADVTTTCPSCPTFTVNLAWDSVDNVWRGDSLMCGHPITLSIACPFTTLFFSAAPCVSATPTAAATCSPIAAVFSFGTSGIGCCGGSSLISPAITVTIYE